MTKKDTYGQSSGKTGERIMVTFSLVFVTALVVGGYLLFAS